MDRENNVPGVHFLLSSVDPADAATVRRRLGIGEPEVERAGWWAWRLLQLRAPRSVLLWMLERDDPATNALAYHHPNVTDAIRRDIVRGVPFGTARGPLPVVRTCVTPGCVHDEPRLVVSPFGLVGGLRRARSMATARAAAGAVGKADWPEVAEADRVEPLPGYARWVLSTRVDCPPEVRAQFGSHPKFTHRLKRAGIVADAREYADHWGPARSVLDVLRLGTALFPARAREAAELLGPLVRRELGANLDAWAALARVLPTFSGTPTELVRTCGEVASV
ncbi:hypothetical protein [Saccharothrix sp. NRRL B-16348]|uniref:hypothetical protein n=1 Tax=Saccharothrix sp. NRRL B-16348 TaxID=1415542 RepID=UPI0006AE8FE9|nr:hypothetical protein [Saccharothrix sp. NRRL B-16348]